LPEQLNKDIPIPKKKIPWIRYFLQITLPAFLLSMKSNAQNKLPVDTIVTIKDQPKQIILGFITMDNGLTVSGKVTDADGNAVSHATIMVKGTTKGTITDSLGNFKISDVKNNESLICTSVGFDSQEVTIKGNRNINIQLIYSSMPLGGVVLISYSTPRKRSKSEIKKEAIKNEPIKPSLHIYPNPVMASSHLNISWKGLEAGDYLIEVYNNNGLLLQTEKMKIEKKLSQYNFDLMKLLAGNYFIKIVNTNNGKQVSQQFIVKE
jgi:hypothetical protein